MTQSIASAEFRMDKGFHPKPGHTEENQNDVFSKIAAPAGVVVIGAKAWSFRSAAQPCHTEGPEQTRRGRARATCR